MITTNKNIISVIVALDIESSFLKNSVNKLTDMAAEGIIIIPKKS